MVGPVLQLLAISRNTFTESIRQPVYLVLILLFTLALVLNPTVSSYTFENDTVMMIDTGLSTLLLAGLWIAAFTATGVITQEIEQKTALTVISKPVPRPIFVFGKFLGVIFALALAFWILSIIFLLTVRHEVIQAAYNQFDQPVLMFGFFAGFFSFMAAAIANYFYRWVFSSTLVMLLGASLTVAYLMVLFTNKEWQYQNPGEDLDRNRLIAMGMVFISVLIMSSFAVALSTRLGQIVTIILSIIVFVLGVVSHWIHTRASTLAAEYDSVFSWIGLGAAKLLYFLMPNLQLLWPGEALYLGTDFTLDYIGRAILYAGLMIAAMLSLAVFLFQSREVG